MLIMKTLFKVVSNMYFFSCYTITYHTLLHYMLFLKESKLFWRQIKIAKNNFPKS